MREGHGRKQPLSLHTYVHATTKKSQKFLCPQKGGNIQNENLGCDEGEVLLLLGSWGEEEVNLLPGNKKQIWIPGCLGQYGVGLSRLPMNT